MIGFDTKAEYLKNGLRGTFLILPLKADGEMDIRSVTFADATEIGFDSESMSDLIRHKCARAQGFVRRFRLPSHDLRIDYEDGFSIPISDTQIAVFGNGIAFLIVYFYVAEADISRVYAFVNPGYIHSRDQAIQQQFINRLRREVLSGSGFDFYVEGENKDLAIKEAYLLNAAFVDCRFEELALLDKTTFLAHKLISLSADFEDASEMDITYTYGARDVENKTFRWGCCISSQSISFVYGPSNNNYDGSGQCAIRPSAEMSVEDMLLTAEDDLLLTVLALYQKHTCMFLNEELYRQMKEGGGSRKVIQKIKRAALMFKAYETLPPSQISRWNNVCETYRHLLKLNGVTEALSEIGDNIELINDEQEKITEERRNFFGTIIAVFGMISIIAAVLQIVDYVGPGDPMMLRWMIISCAGIAALGVAWIIMMLGRKR